MKRFSIFVLLATLLMGACSESLTEQDALQPEFTTPTDLTAGFADNSLARTYVEDGKYLRWHEADLITAFYGNTLNRQYKFKGATGDNSGTFSLVPSGELGTGNELEAIYALYPYDENATITDEGVISLTLPAVQTYAENSFGKGANTMVAVTESVEDTFLPFKNACGYLKLNLYNADGATLKSVVVKGNNDEKIAGAATVAMEFGGVPELTMGNDATTTVTLDCGDGIALGTTAETATELWIVLPETTFEGGITITATDSDDGVFEKSTSNTVAITRNDIQPMAALEAVFEEPKPANNEIWYTNGSTTEATAPYKTDVFGANIVSNTYDADKECWVIKFDGDVAMIGDAAFCFRNSLSSMKIPESVTSIGKEAFRSCSNLISFIIPDSVTTIGDDAFYYCEKLTSITIPSSVLSIGANAFRECAKLTNLIISEGVTAIGMYAFSYCSNLKSVIIPDSVTSIGRLAFCGCSKLESVNMPNSVLSIGDSLFDNCNSLPIIDNIRYADTFAIAAVDTTLSTYTLKEGTRWIDSSAFYGCSSLESINIPNGVISIGGSAFYGCSSLESIDIPYGVISIGGSAFYGCSSLASITIPDSVSSLSSFVFQNCSSLVSVTLPNNITSIQTATFSNCAKLKNITIPNSVTSIKSQAFYNCSSLISITIPSNVTSVESSAFDGCSSLKTVYCKPTTPPTGGYGMFDNNASSRTIYVPSASKSAYLAKDYWSNYASSIVGYNF